MASEQQAFVFAVVFMVVFSTLLAAWPAGLQGPEETPENITPLNPSLLTDFTDYENYTRAAFLPPEYLLYGYADLGGRDWLVYWLGGTEFYITAKIMLWGWIWLGGSETVKFSGPNGARGESLSFAEIVADADNGSVRYDLTFTTDGSSAGGFVIYWNTTLYADPEDAWDNNQLYMLHGVGIADTTGENILGLLFSLLFLQLPDVPLVIGILLAVPVWASIIYIIWFIIISMIPFLGGA